MDMSIRRVSIAESADFAARQAVATQTPAQNPHEVGSDDWKAWKACYERFLLLHSAPDLEASA